MKIVAAIRLAVATALIFLFLGTTAFAHEGHSHGGQSERASEAASSAHLESAKLPFAAAFSKLNLADLHPGTTGTVISASSDSGCEYGCCCCGSGSSTCGMSGCSALGLPAADGFVLRPMTSDKLVFAIADVLSGRVGSGLDRPPKV